MNFQWRKLVTIQYVVHIRSNYFLWKHLHATLPIDNFPIGSTKSAFQIFDILKCSFHWIFNHQFFFQNFMSSRPYMGLINTMRPPPWCTQIHRGLSKDTKSAMVVMMVRSTCLGGGDLNLRKENKLPSLIEKML